MEIKHGNAKFLVSLHFIYKRMSRFVQGRLFRLPQVDQIGVMGKNLPYPETKSPAIFFKRVNAFF